MENGKLLKTGGLNGYPFLVISTINYQLSIINYQLSYGFSRSFEA